MTFFWIVLATLAILVAICLFALVDQYQTLQLIRVALELDDSSTPLPLPADVSLIPSRLGLPPHLDDRERLVLLFLSTSCSTCRTIAEDMERKYWPSTWVILEGAATVAEGQKWLEHFGVPSDCATVDVGGVIAETLQVNVTPAAILYEDRRALIAQTIPSYRQLTGLLSSRTSKILHSD